MNIKERLQELIAGKIKELDLNSCAVVTPDLSKYKSNFVAYLRQKLHGQLSFLQRNIRKRLDPSMLFLGTESILVVTQNYADFISQTNPMEVLNNPNLGYISRYALGRDYHKVLKQKLKKLAEFIIELKQQGLLTKGLDIRYRIFVDSAPVYESGLAELAQLGFKGNHSLVINPEYGSFFFIGTIYFTVDLTKFFPVNKLVFGKCEPCIECIKTCPTSAIIAKGVVDARRCISYLTIESKGALPKDLRRAIGNRVYGCDDCQLVCPWNRFHQNTTEKDYIVRNNLDKPSLISLLQITPKEFQQKFRGSVIYRIGWARLMRNVINAIGNNYGNKGDIQNNINALKKFIKIYLNNKSSQLTKQQLEVLQEQMQWSLEILKSKYNNMSKCNMALQQERQITNKAGSKIKRVLIKEINYRNTQ